MAMSLKMSCLAPVSYPTNKIGLMMAPMMTLFLNVAVMTMRRRYIDFTIFLMLSEIDFTKKSY